MAIVGRILIMPKGAYDPAVTYEMLDLVSHNGTSWLAKKTAKGKEPSLENSDYWQKMLEGPLTVEETLSFENGEAEYSKDLTAFGYCQNVVVTPVDSENSFSTHIVSTDQSDFTILVKDLTDSASTGTATFRITYFL